MNTFISINTEYLRSSRTIETVEVNNSKTKKIFYVYNYEGYSFRVFKNVIDLIGFFEVNSNEFLHFNTELELDNYFCKVNLSKQIN
jgi:hypothetical protein